MEGHRSIIFENNNVWSEYFFREREREIKKSRKRWLCINAKESNEVKFSFCCCLKASTVEFQSTKDRNIKETKCVRSVRGAVNVFCPMSESLVHGTTLSLHYLYIKLVIIYNEREEGFSSSVSSFFIFLWTFSILLFPLSFFASLEGKFLLTKLNKNKRISLSLSIYAWKVDIPVECSLNTLHRSFPWILSLFSFPFPVKIRGSNLRGIFSLEHFFLFLFFFYHPCRQLFIRTII